MAINPCFQLNSYLLRNGKERSLNLMCFKEYFKCIKTYLLRHLTKTLQIHIYITAKDIINVINYKPTSLTLISVKTLKTATGSTAEIKVENSNKLRNVISIV